MDSYICMGRSDSVKRQQKTIIASVVALILIGLIIGNFKKVENEKVDTVIEETERTEVIVEGNDEETEVEELTAREQMIQDVVNLIDEGLAFDAGSYIKGDIPKGDYVFVTFDGSGKYYSEEDASGDIVDNENFSSFGYVYVHEVGNIETRGVLIKLEALERLEVSGAKELYEIMNELEDYSDAGWYKVGVDIEPGEYIFESHGSGYVAVMSGPVGNSSIINNKNFNGRYSINVQDGQYLVISRATIVE